MTGDGEGHGVLACCSPWPWGHKESDTMSDWVQHSRQHVVGSNFLSSILSICSFQLDGSIYWYLKPLLEDRNGNLLQYSCLGNPLDRGAQWTVDHRLKRVGHNLATDPPPPPCVFSHKMAVLNTGLNLFSSVKSLSCVSLCNPMDCRTPGFPVHHQLPELAQTCVPDNLCKSVMEIYRFLD